MKSPPAEKIALAIEAPDDLKRAVCVNFRVLPASVAAHVYVVLMQKSVGIVVAVDSGQ